MVDLVFEGSAFSVQVDSDVVKFQVPGNILFQPNSTQVSLEGRRYLAKLSPVIKEYYGTVTVAGHADLAQYEKQPDIWDLSFKRALSVRDYLVKIEGVKSSVLLPAAKGDTELAERNPASFRISRNKNRRVEFIFTHSRKAQGIRN
jgi:flagellar motor protein MotB